MEILFVILLLSTWMLLGFIYIAWSNFIDIPIIIYDTWLIFLYLAIFSIAGVLAKKYAKILFLSSTIWLKLTGVIELISLLIIIFSFLTYLFFSRFHLPFTLLPAVIILITGSTVLAIGFLFMKRQIKK